MTDSRGPGWETSSSRRRRPPVLASSRGMEKEGGEERPASPGPPPHAGRRAEGDLPEEQWLPLTPVSRRTRGKRCRQAPDSTYHFPMGMRAGQGGTGECRRSRRQPSHEVWSAPDTPRSLHGD